MAALSPHSALLRRAAAVSSSLPSLHLPFSRRTSPALTFSSGCAHTRRFGWGAIRAVTGSDISGLSKSGLEIGGDGGDGGSNGGWTGGSGDGEGKDEGDEKKMSGGLSMSQKLTLGYAALVAVGGIMGFMKTGSQKSLAAGGLSALLLIYVYNELPVRASFASSIGLGLSAALLAVMGPRFMKSKKLFPAGIVSFVSFIMAGGYLHGLLRSVG